MLQGHRGTGKNIDGESTALPPLTGVEVDAHRGRVTIRTLMPPTGKLCPAGRRTSVAPAPRGDWAAMFVLTSVLRWPLTGRGTLS